MVIPVFYLLLLLSFLLFWKHLLLFCAAVWLCISVCVGYFSKKRRAKGSPNLHTHTRPMVTVSVYYVCAFFLLHCKTKLMARHKNEWVSKKKGWILFVLVKHRKKRIWVQIFGRMVDFFHFVLSLQPIVRYCLCPLV